MERVDELALPTFDRVERAGRAAIDAGSADDRDMCGVVGEAEQRDSHELATREGEDSVAGAAASRASGCDRAGRVEPAGVAPSRCEQLRSERDLIADRRRCIGSLP